LTAFAPTSSNNFNHQRLVSILQSIPELNTNFKMGKKRAREEAKDVPPADVDKMDEDGSDGEVGKSW